MPWRRYDAMTPESRHEELLMDGQGRNKDGRWLMSHLA